MKPETKFRNKILPLLRKIPESWWESIQQVSIRGTPDVIGVIKGRFIALELKADNGQPSKMQANKLKLIEEAGGYAKLVYPDNFYIIYKELVCL